MTAALGWDHMGNSRENVRGLMVMYQIAPLELFSLIYHPQEREKKECVYIFGQMMRQKWINQCPKLPSKF